MSGHQEYECSKCGFRWESIEPYQGCPKCRDGIKPEIPEHIRQREREANEWTSKSVATQSLLYDLDLLPEQLEEGTRKWIQMLIIVAHMKSAYEEGKASLVLPTPP